MTGDMFDEIGLAYARRFADLEAARDIFSKQRDDALARLDDVLGAALQAQAITMTPTRAPGAVYRTQAASKYTAARVTRGKKGAAGIQLELGVLDRYGHPDTFGFAATCFFGMGRPQLVRIQQSSSALSGVVVNLQGTYLYVVYRVIPIGDGLTLDACQGELGPLVDAYVKLDAALAAAVAAESPSSGEGDGESV